jgi:hypothetical protein
MAPNATEGGVILPDLSKRVAWYQDRLRPEDSRFGVGIADWTITAEYAPNLEMDGAPIWGMMGSPPNGLVKLTSEDVAAKRAHIVIRTPANAEEFEEIERTLIHELGHVLHAKLNLPREEEEEIMHSLDHLYSKLSPEQRVSFARAMTNPMARAYRAKEETMPDMEEKKEPDKEAPKMQEGVMSVDEINAAIVKAVLAGQPTEELSKKLVEAMAVAGASNGPPSAPPPVVAPEPPSMGMKPDEAYARARKEAKDAQTEAIEAIIEANPHLDDKQKAMARKQATAKDARELVESYPRVNAYGATLGMIKRPEGQLSNKGANGLQGEQARSMARQMGAKGDKPAGPSVLANGRFTMGNMTPTQLRAEIEAGRDPRKQFPSTLGV